MSDDDRCEHESGQRSDVRLDGLVVAATNGRRHMQELAQIRGQVFDLSTVDQTVEVFGAETGFAILRQHFGDIRWLQCNDASIAETGQ